MLQCDGAYGTRPGSSGGSRWRTPSSRCTRGAAIAAATSMRCASTLTATCMIAPRRRFEPALPTTSRGCPRSSTSDGAIMLVIRSPGRGAPTIRSNSPSMLFMWMPVSGDDDVRAAAARGGGERGRVPGGVDDADVRRAAALAESSGDAALARAGLLVHHVGEQRDGGGRAEAPGTLEPPQPVSRSGRRRTTAAGSRRTRRRGTGRARGAGG